MTLLLRKNNILRIALVVVALFVLLAGVLAIARTETSYSNDKSNYRFTSDIKTSYLANESTDIEVSFIDTNTGEKPVGVSLTMQVDDGPVRTVLSSSSNTNTRFVNMGDLSQGAHRVTFTLPEACGNFFDFSNFGTQTRFDNQFDCQFVRQFSVGAIIDAGACTDPDASNFNPAAVIDDGSCVYLVDGCTNSAATNYDPDATNNDGSCIFPPNILNGCTDPDASNYVPTAQNDDGSCEYYVFGCTDSRALNYNPAATASDASCQYDGTVTPSSFECSINNQLWTACEGRTFTLKGPNDNIFVRTEPQSAGDWSDWCTGDLNNGVQATFNELTSNGQNAEVAFTFANPGTLFNMTLCLNPDSLTKAQTFQRIKLKLLDTKFIEN